MPIPIPEYERRRIQPPWRDGAPKHLVAGERHRKVGKFPCGGINAGTGNGHREDDRRDQVVETVSFKLTVPAAFFIRKEIPRRPVPAAWKSRAQLDRQSHLICSCDTHDGFRCDRRAQRSHWYPQTLVGPLLLATCSTPATDRRGR